MTEKEFFATVHRIEDAMRFIATNGDIKGIMEKMDNIQRFMLRFRTLEELIEHLKCVEKYIFYGKERLTMDESAIYLGIKKSSLYKLTSAHEITVTKPKGKLIYIEKKELDRWMGQNELLNDDEIRRLGEMKVDELRKKFGRGKSFIK